MNGATILDTALSKEFAAICAHVDAYPYPTGLVDSTDIKRFVHMIHVAGGVKIVARHVCDNRPSSIPERPADKVTAEHRLLLKRALRKIDCTCLPRQFRYMVWCLMNERLITLPSDLYEAIFGCELHFREFAGGPFEYKMTLLKNRKQLEEQIYNTLFCAGYKVYLKGMKPIPTYPEPRSE